MKVIVQARDVFFRLLFMTVLVTACLASSADFSSAENLLDIGISEYRNENFEEALQILKKAKQLQPGSSVASFYLGLTYKQMGEHNNAVIHLKDAITLTPSVTDAYAELIEILYGMEELNEASVWLTKAEQEKVTPAKIAFLKGMVLSKQGENSRAIESFRKTKDLDKSLSQSADFQIAMIHAKDRKITEARESLKAVIAIDPNSEFATFAKDYEAAINKLSALHRTWRLTAGAAYQYDDNVVLKPSGTVGISSVDDITGKRDSSIIGTFRVDYNPLLSGPWFLNAQYNLYTNTYFRTFSHDIMQHSVSATPGYSFNKGALSLLLNYTHAWVNEERYMGVFTARPTLHYIVSPGHIAHFSLGYSRREMVEAALDKDEERDSDIITGSIGYIHPFAQDKGVFNLGYEYSKDKAKGRNWENTGNRISAGILAPLAEKLSLTISGEAFLQDYDNTHSVFGVKREDKIYSGSAGLIWDFMKNMNLNLQYSHTTADSNIAIYDYKRNIYTVGMQLSF